MGRFSAYRNDGSAAGIRVGYCPKVGVNAQRNGAVKKPKTEILRAREFLTSRLLKVPQ